MADLGSIGRNIMPLRVPFIGGTISGSVLDVDSNPAVRTVVIINRVTKVIDAVLTTRTDGTYIRAFPPTDSANERTVLCLDDDAGTLENDLVLRTFPV